MLACIPRFDRRGVKWMESACVFFRLRAAVGTIEPCLISMDLFNAVLIPAAALVHGAGIGRQERGRALYTFLSAQHQAIPNTKF
ncbi:uncharacterized protein VTP21DRAFT_2468 [Calcarisporiella thermophila]|uniref:uncharacterized protein n=1 Tax=Calcarisporiella thermophila TaxID=911321 RepID=UPI00374273AC